MRSAPTEVGDRDLPQRVGDEAQERAYVILVGAAGAVAFAGQSEGDQGGVGIRVRQWRRLRADVLVLSCIVLRRGTLVLLGASGPQLSQSASVMDICCVTLQGVRLA